VLCRPTRPPELRQSVRPPVLAARCPTIAPPHPPPGAPPTASAAPAASAAAAHPAVAAWPPPATRRAAGHERDARRACGSVARSERGHSSPGRRYSAAAAHPGAVPPAAPTGATQVRSPTRPRSALPDHRPPPIARRASRRERGRSSPGRRCSAAAHRPPPGAPPAASVAATHLTASHERDAQCRCRAARLSP